jgi:O-antigen ligase
MVVHKWFTILFFAFLPVWFAVGSVPLIRIIALLWILFWAARNLVRHEFFLPAPLVLFFFLSFVGWATLSVLWAQDASWALRKLFFWYNIFPLFLVFTDIFRDTNLRRTLYRSLFCAGIIAASIGVLQVLLQLVVPVGSLFHFWVALLPWFLGGGLGDTVTAYPSLLVNINGATLLRASAFFPDPHIFAYCIVMLLPLTLWRSRNFPRVWRVLTLLLMLVALGASFSRSGYVALLVGMLYAVWHWRARFLRYLNPLRVTLLALFLGTILLSPVATRFVSSFSSHDGSVSERSRLLQEALVNIPKAPLAGVGLGNYPLLVKPTAEFREPIYVHNMYLDIAGELGLIGLGLFLGFCMTVFLLPQKSATLPVAPRALLVMSLSMFAAQSLFENPLFSVHITPLFLLFLALLYVEPASQDPL